QRSDRGCVVLRVAREAPGPSGLLGRGADGGGSAGGNDGSSRGGVGVVRGRAYMSIEEYNELNRLLESVCDLLARAQDAERLEVFERIWEGYCKHCGCDNP